MDGIVVVGILGSVQSAPPDAGCHNDPEDRTRKFIEGFPNHVFGSFCAEYIGANLVAALEVIQTAWMSRAGASGALGTRAGTC